MDVIKFFCRLIVQTFLMATIVGIICAMILIMLLGVDLVINLMLVDTTLSSPGESEATFGTREKRKFYSVTC